MLISPYHAAVQLFILLIAFVVTTPLGADVVKPALIEINVDQSGKINIEARVSIEALLTGINSQYKNTNDSPNAAAYDVFRKMQSEDLALAFALFQDNFLDQIYLKNTEDKKLNLEIINVKIPEPGYTKVPRISLIEMHSAITLDQTTITWFYPALFGDNAVRVRQVNEETHEYHWSDWQWLRNNKASQPFSINEIITQKPLYKTITEYVVLGFAHILPKGLDHILFILGLFFFSIALKPLFWQITMFTLAHTLTLGLSINGIINIPANIVEPLIALSTVYIGVENVISNLTNNVINNTINEPLRMSRLAVVFVFGLIHGLGFASVLADFGLPNGAMLTALISFNIGVEIGQIFIIIVAFLAFGVWFRNKSWYRASISIPASLIISSIAFYWFIQRLDLNF